MSVYENYICEGQMSIFDSLEMLPEEEMVARVSEAVGLKFERDDFFGWVFKQNGFKIHVNYSRYSFGDRNRFISCGISDKTSGQTGPYDSIDGAINAIKIFKKKIERKEIKK